ncbi:RNA-binding protein, partial [Mycoplasmopsis pullorum]
LEGDGTLIKTGMIYPNPPINKIKESSEIILKEINQHAPQMILIGNGTASWETRDFIEKLLEKNKFNIPVEIVSESGASVYSASELAQEEFPELSVELRSTINIGRRFQDPLNEIIKIDPKSIGIGQYQHDVNQKELGEELDFKIFKTINLVGVNLNSATKHILLHVSGINKKTAQNIVEYRNENGLFKNRNELKKVKGLGAKSFEQSVGFLRIYGSSEFLDSTNIHPESYKVARQIMEYLNYDVQTQKFEKDYQIDELAQKFKISIYDVELIIDSLLNPARDIRDRKSGFKIDYSLKTIDDLAINNSYNGRIENITDFGVFIFVGIKESVFVHNSKITGSFNKNDLFIGQDLLVEILEINKENGRISGLIK